MESLHLGIQVLLESDLIHAAAYHAETLTSLVISDTPKLLHSPLFLDSELVYKPGPLKEEIWESSESTILTD